MEQKTSNERSKKFVKDLGIYAIGNLGSKLITFMLVPLYTYYITDPAEFGYYDICLAIVFCFVPVVSLQLGESAFRFLLDDTDADKRKQIITFVTSTIIRNSIFIIIIAFLLSLFISIRYLPFIIIFGLAQTIYDVSLQVVRGLGHTKIFMTCGLFNSLLLASGSLFFIVLFDFGVPGIFYANILSRLITFLYIEIKLKILRKYFSVGIDGENIHRKMLHYSLPLLPAVLIWWVLNSSNVFFIKQFLGLEENGIYAIIAKFTSILYVLSLIFYQAWQQNAIEEYNSPNRNKFFSQVFNSYIFLLCGLAIAYPFCLRLNYGWLVGAEYRVSVRYLYFNGIYIIFYALAAFYELGYQCAKHTERILPSFILITIIGLTCNYLLIKPLGINGVILANIITYVSLLIYRIFDTRKYMKISFDIRNIKAIILTLIGALIYTYFNSIIIDILAIIIFGALFIFICPPYIKGTAIQKFNSIISK